MNSRVKLFGADKYSKNAGYRFAVYENKVYTLGDVIAMASQESQNYYGVIENLYLKKKVPVMYVRWFYRWSDFRNTKYQPISQEFENEFFYSYHFDENSIETILELSSVSVVKYSTDESNIPKSSFFIRYIFDNHNHNFHKINEAELNNSGNDPDLRSCLSRLLYIADNHPLTHNFLTFTNFNRRFIEGEIPKLENFPVPMAVSANTKKKITAEHQASPKKQKTPKKSEPDQEIRTPEKQSKSNIIIEEVETTPTTKTIKQSDLENSSRKRKLSGVLVSENDIIDSSDEEFEMEVTKPPKSSKPKPKSSPSKTRTQPTRTRISDLVVRSIPTTPRKLKTHHQEKRKEVIPDPEVDYETLDTEDEDENMETEGNKNEQKKLVKLDEFKIILQEGFDKFFQETSHLPWSSQVTR